MQVNSVRNEVYQLIGFYTVFQGVILTAAAQSSVLKCHNWWTTFFLGLLASLIVIVGVVQKFATLRSLDERIRRLEGSLKGTLKQASILKREGEKFSFEILANDVQLNRYYPCVSYKRGPLGITLGLVVATLLLFSG